MRAGIALAAALVLAGFAAIASPSPRVAPVSGVARTNVAIDSVRMSTAP